MYRSSDNKALTDAPPGLALACLTRYPKPFLHFKQSLLARPLSPEASTTAAHKSLISFVHAVHPLKGCSLLCLPLPHQQTSVLAQSHLSFSKGAINAFPLRNWKNLVATLLGALQSWGLMPGLEAAVGSLNALLPAFLSMSLRHC